ncbi:MAG TPA: carotenoid biosynthesis protein [Candidatus Limnocylindrales bacterium]|nr:carotenoid biosynthesis protein [Candidatus Limnocylindrales bacterium]
MSRAPYALIEVAMVALFLLALVDAGRRGRPAVLELLSAVPFGLLLEQGDIMIFGSYAYNQAFFLKIGAVPIAIALAWAMIIRSCMGISDRAGVPAHLAPLADALLAIILDLSFDTIAIRQGLWHWNIHLDQGFFGVPAGNYYAWLFVALGFSAWTRVVRRSTRTRPSAGWLQLLVPLPAYATLLAAMIPFIALEKAFFAHPGGGFPTFGGTLILFAALSARPLIRGRARLAASSSAPLLPRLALHGYALLAGVLLGIFSHLPALLAVSLAMLGIEVWLTGAPKPELPALVQRDVA